VAKTATAAAETRAQNGQSRDVHDEHLPLDAVSMLVLPWLQDLIEDYLQGEKARRIQTVSKALGCEASAACAHLCAHRWNVETTLRRQRAANSLAAQRAQVQKLTQDALEEVASATEAATASVANEATRDTPSSPQTRSETNEVGSTRVVSSSDLGSPEETLQRRPDIASATMSTLQPVGNSRIASVQSAPPVGDSGDVAPTEELRQSKETEVDPLELLKQLSAAAEDVDNHDEGDECPICVQPYGKFNEQLMTKCCDQALCAHCAATLATNDGQLRCPFCRRVDRHPAVIEGPRAPAVDMLEGANSFARDVGRFFKDLFGSPAERESPSRPNLRLDVVFR
jgi:hypothetical protein